MNLTKEVNQLTDQSIKLNDEFNQLQKRVNTVAQELNNCHISMNERTSIKQSIQPNQEKLQKDLEQLQQTCQENQNISTDGTLTWRITRVSEKMADAQSERQTSIYSPIFYSSPTGYKMRARLFLFGDGNARRTHMSLFFLLMKGDYDAILKWPFHYKVTFCLLDQTGNNRHIIDSFHPDVKSNSFQRPKENANIASGIPKFFPLPMLLQDDNAYVREDTLYIKIIIALNDTPKALLPFMLTLNPALPNFVQENMINQEAIKRQSQPTTASNS
jgi:TNF receptor-associated factor 2